MDGQTNGWMDRQTNGWMDGQVGRQAGRKSDIEMGAPPKK